RAPRTRSRCASDGGARARREGSAPTGRSVTRASEHGRLAPDAPDLAESVAHLTHRDVRTRGVENRVHQVRVVARSVLLEPHERRFDRRRIAARAKRLDAVGLLALERRVDLEDLERLLTFELVAVHADH